MHEFMVNVFVNGQGAESVGPLEAMTATQAETLAINHICRKLQIDKNKIMGAAAFYRDKLDRRKKSCGDGI